MQIKKLLLSLWYGYGFLFLGSHAFFIKPNTAQIQVISSQSLSLHRILPINNYPGRPHEPIRRFVLAPKTKTAFLRLIRSQNILPTCLLYTSGAWIMKPSLKDILKNGAFFVGLVNTLLILSSSMIVNDIYDIEIDRKNNPDRPLVTGEISKPVAIDMVIGFLGAAELFNLAFLPESLFHIVHAAILQILIYTPLLKKIPGIKNVSCATLVAFSMVFSALIISSQENIIKNVNYPLFSILVSTVFLGSLYNEILLDVCDVSGDRENHIWTLPVLFGKNGAISILGLILLFGLNVCYTRFISIYKKPLQGLPIVLLFSPMVYHLFQIKRHKFEKNVILCAVRQTNIPLLLSVGYFSFLSYQQMQIPNKLVSL